MDLIISEITETMGISGATASRVMKYSIQNVLMTSRDAAYPFHPFSGGMKPDGAVMIGSITPVYTRPKRIALLRKLHRQVMNFIHSPYIVSGTHVWRDKGFSLVCHNVNNLKAVTDYLLPLGHEGTGMSIAGLSKKRGRTRCSRLRDRLQFEVRDISRSI